MTLPLLTLHFAALTAGFLLDLLLGDPHWAPHPVRAIGRLIAALEPPLRRVFPSSDRGLLAAGAAMVVLVLLIPTALTVLLLYLWADVREIAGIVKESKREILRGSLNARAAESFPNFQEEEKKERQKNREKQGAEEKKPQGVPLNASEQQVLDEVLTEFLG